MCNSELCFKTHVLEIRQFTVTKPEMEGLLADLEEQENEDEL